MTEDESDIQVLAANHVSPVDAADMITPHTDSNPPLQDAQTLLENTRRRDDAPIIAKIEHNAVPPRLAFSVKETAGMLGVSEKTVHRLIARGLLRPSRALRHLLIPKTEIEKFLDRTTTK
jgi:excisionase family DNA binding protein